jgi:serum/glucocorticoid-regulated kinase 2
MPSVDQDPLLLPPLQPTSPSKKRSPRTVLGLSNILLQRPDNTQVRSRPTPTKPPVFARTSLSPRRRRKPRAEIQNLNTLSFFESDSTVHVENETPPSPTPNMTATRERQSRPARRQVLRVDAQDGPWTVSVAENPHHPSSYTLYVKSEYPFAMELSENSVVFVFLRPILVSHFPFHFTV